MDIEFIILAFELITIIFILKDGVLWTKLVGIMSLSMAIMFYLMKYDILLSMISGAPAVIIATYGLYYFLKNVSGF